MRLWKRSLTARMAGTFLALSLVTVVIVGMLAFVQARNRLEEMVYTQLRLVAVGREHELERWINQQRAFVSFLANAPELRSQISALTDQQNPQQAAAYLALSAYLRSIIATQPDLREIMLLDERHGTILVSTSSEHEGRIQSNQPYFLHGRQNMSVEPPYYSTLSNELELTIVTPLLDEVGTRQAVLAVHLNLDQLDRFLLDRTGLGNSGEVMLISSSGDFVASQRFGRTSLPNGRRTAGIAAALRGQRGVAVYQSYNNQIVIGAYGKLAAPPLALVVEIEQDEAFAPARQLAGTIIVAGTLCAGLLAGAVWLLALRIARPLSELTQTAAQVAKGNLQQQVPVTTNDEIGVLGQAFNRMTERLQVLYGEIQRSEEHFRSLIEHASDVILILDEHGVIRYDGPSVRNVLGYQHTLLRGQRLAELVHPDDLSHLLEEIALCFVDDEHTLLVEFRARHTDGSWRVLEGRGERMIDISGQPGIVINARDMSERKRAEEERARLQEENLRVRSEFIATVSHELRTPLTPIRGFLDMLLFKAAGSLTQQQEEFIQVIKTNALRMQSLVDDLLDIGRVQAGKIVLNYDSVDLNGLIRHEIQMLQPEIDRKQMQLSLEIADDLPTIMADSKRISQIVVNLLSNAIKYTHPHGTIMVRSQRNGLEQVEFTITDSGIGLTSEQQQKLFTPFYRADNGLRNEVGGTGLGLCIVKLFTELHGGSVEVQSQVKVGSTFAVKLPIQLQPQAQNGTHPDE